MVRQTLPQVNLQTFIETLFAPIPAGTVPIFSKQVKRNNESIIYVNTPATVKTIKEIERNPGDNYICSSLLTIEQKEVGRKKQKDVWRRKKEYLKHARILVLDDIGTKAKPPKVLPTCILETSENNTQWIYRLKNHDVDNEKGYQQVKGFLDRCAELDYTDSAGLHPGRVSRIPGSLNTKYSPPFASRVLYWQPAKAWTIQALAEAFDIPLSGIPIETSSVADLAFANTFTDPVMAWLIKARLAGEPVGAWANVLCPWRDKHTPGRDDHAGYSPIGVGNNVFFRGYKCHHAHCKDRTARDFLAWVEEQGGPAVAVHGLDELPPNVFQESVKKLSKKKKRDIYKESLPEIFRSDLPDCVISNNGTPLRAQLATQDNTEHILAKLKISPRMDMMAKEIKLKYLDPKIRKILTMKEDKQAYRTLIDTALKLGFGGNRTDVDNILEEFATENSYNPFEQWVMGKEWDGTSRFEDLYNTVMLEERYTRIFRIYLKRWLLQGIQAGCGWRKPKQMRSVLVFAGDQFVGKTEWFKSLAPEEYTLEGVRLDLKTYKATDSIITATSRTLVELGELDTTFRLSDIGALKAFLSTSRDKYRSAYGRFNTEWPRATSYFGSVNHIRFFNDQTGSSRFWPVEVISTKPDHGIDMQQLWREVYEIWKTGEQWWLSDKEEILRKTQSNAFELVEGAIELAETYFAEHDDDVTEVMNVTEFAETIRTTINPRNRGLLSDYLESKLGRRRSLKGRRNCWFIPVNNVKTAFLKEVGNG